MCYYNNRFIDSSYCEGGKNFRPNTILTGFDTVGPTGPTGPTGPCCNNNESIASIVEFYETEELTPLQMATLSPDFLAGPDISVIDGSNYISLSRGSYYINYSATVTPSSSNTISLAFIMNTDTVLSSVSSLVADSTSSVILSKSFLINILDDSQDIALINNSPINITLSNLTISVLKVG